MSFCARVVRVPVFSVSLRRFKSVVSAVCAAGESAAFVSVMSVRLHLSLFLLRYNKKPRPPLRVTGHGSGALRSTRRSKIVCLPSVEDRSPQRLYAIP
jgi:hypothetical protein